MSLLYANRLRKGAAPFLYRGGGVLEYKVVDSVLIDRAQWQYLLPETNRDMVSLFTFDPVYPPYEKRLIINFERTDEAGSMHAEQESNRPLKQVALWKKLVRLGAVSVWVIFFIMVFKFLKIMIKR